MNYLLAPDYTESEIDRNLLKHAKNDLEAMISKRDWYVNDTHHPFLPVALYRTLTRSGKIRRMNEAIEYMQAKVDRLEQELEATSVYIRPVQVIPEQIITLLNMLTASGLAWCGSIDDVQVIGQPLLTKGGSCIKAYTQQGVLVYESTTPDQSSIDYEVVCKQSLGTFTSLEAHTSLRNTQVTMRVTSNDEIALASSNNWEIGIYPPRIESFER